MRRLVLFIILLLTFSVAYAQDDGEATAEPAAAGTEFTLPAPPESLDMSIVIGRVGDETVTLGQYATRVRYERLRRYRAFDSLVEIAGVEALNPDAPDNLYAADVLNFLATIADDNQLGAIVYDTMLVEALYRQEGAARGLTVDDCASNEFWMLMLGYQDVFDCDNLPTDLEENKAAYLQLAEAFTGITPQEISVTLEAVALYDMVQEQLRTEAPIEEVAAVASRHIRVTDATVAQEIMDRLSAGEDFDALLAEYTEDSGAVGNRGALGLIARGQTVTEFEDAAFGAEVGEIAGPVQTQYGWHVIQVAERIPTASARHILVETEADADSIIELLNGGADFADVAQRFSQDPGSAQAGGDLGTFAPDQMVAPFADAVFNAQAGDIVGPVETQFGWHVIEVLRLDPVGEVNVSHILVDTEEEAQAVIERINAGEDFGDVAEEVSIDPSAAGHRGDTLAVVTGGAQIGLYVPEEVPFEIASAVFPDEVPVGDIIGPIELSDSFFILKVEEKGMRAPMADSVVLAQDYYVRDWENAQYDGERIQETTLWRLYVPFDLLPSDYNADYLPLDAAYLAAREAYLTGDTVNSIPNILRDLQVDLVPPDASGE